MREGGPVAAANQTAPFSPRDRMTQSRDATVIRDAVDPRPHDLIRDAGEPHDLIRDAAAVIRDAALLVCESRVPELSPRGHTEGRHSPQIAIQSHTCTSENSECCTVAERIREIDAIVQSEAPVVLEVLLHSDCADCVRQSSSLLLEAWFFQKLSRRYGENTLEASSLFSAIKSYLHFSQLSSWLVKSGGKSPRSISYRISAGGDVAPDNFADFDAHSFPTVTDNKKISSFAVSASVKFLKRHLHENPPVVSCRRGISQSEISGRETSTEVSRKSTRRKSSKNESSQKVFSDISPESRAKDLAGLSSSGEESPPCGAASPQCGAVSPECGASSPQSGAIPKRAPPPPPSRCLYRKVLSQDSSSGSSPDSSTTTCGTLRRRKTDDSSPEQLSQTLDDLKLRGPRKGEAKIIISKMCPGGGGHSSGSGESSLEDSWDVEEFSRNFHCEKSRKGAHRSHGARKKNSRKLFQVGDCSYDSGNIERNVVQNEESDKNGTLKSRRKSSAAKEGFSLDTTSNDSVTIWLRNDVTLSGTNQNSENGATGQSPQLHTENSHNFHPRSQEIPDFSRRYSGNSDCDRQYSGDSDVEVSLPDVFSEETEENQLTIGAAESSELRRQLQGLLKTRNLSEGFEVTRGDGRISPPPREALELSLPDFTQSLPPTPNAPSADQMMFFLSPELPPRQPAISPLASSDLKYSSGNPGHGPGGGGGGGFPRSSPNLLQLAKSAPERDVEQLMRVQPSTPQSSFKRAFSHSSNPSPNSAFNRRTGLPLASSPIAFRKIRKSSTFHSKDSLDLENNDELASSSSCRSDSSCSSQLSLVMNFEESVLNGRLEPCGVIEGFKADIGAASGGVCTRHASIPFSARYYDVSSDGSPSPYFGYIPLDSLGKRGYKVPRKGQVQVTLFNPSGSVIKMFIVLYDLTSMPRSSHTFLRQRTFFMPSADSDPRTSPEAALRYLLHLRFQTSSQNKIYLHTDIRCIFSRYNSDQDSSHDGYKLKTFTEVPKNPQFSPKK